MIKERNKNWMSKIDFHESMGQMLHSEQWNVNEIKKTEKQTTDTLNSLDSNHDVIEKRETRKTAVLGRLLLLENTKGS